MGHTGWAGPVPGRLAGGGGVPRRACTGGGGRLCRAGSRGWAASWYRGVRRAARGLPGGPTGRAGDGGPFRAEKRATWAARARRAGFPGGAGGAARGAKRGLFRRGRSGGPARAGLRAGCARARRAAGQGGAPGAKNPAAGVGFSAVSDGAAAENPRHAI